VVYCFTLENYIEEGASYHLFFFCSHPEITGGSSKSHLKESTHVYYIHASIPNNFIDIIQKIQKRHKTSKTIVRNSKKNKFEKPLHLQNIH
jgi:hypothetical protein